MADIGRILALGAALALQAPGAAAQALDDSDAEAEAAVVLARADSARAELVQPPASKGPSIAHLVRTPFHWLGATVALVAATGYGAFSFLEDEGVLDAALELDRELDAQGIHLRPDFIGSRSWPALVVRWEPLDPFFAEAGISLRGYTLLRGGIALGDTLTGIELAAGRHDMNQLHFWGVGPDSDPDDRSDYRLVRREAAISAWTPLARHVRLIAGAGLEDNRLGRGEDEKRPDLQDVFPGPRFASRSDRFARADAGLDIDFTSLEEGDQLAGARLIGGWSLYHGVDDTDAGFQVGRADARLFAPVSDRHAVALRGLVAETWGEDGDGIPFYHLPALGDDDGLRGFRSWRFRDRALAAATAEWRYRVWNHVGDPIYRLDGVAFVDHGAVASALGDLARDDFETTPGIGLRFVRAGIGLAEGYVAFGGEQGARWGIELGTTF